MISRSEYQKKRRKKRKKIMYICLFCFFVLMLCICLFKIFIWGNDNKITKLLQEKSIKDSVTEREAKDAVSVNPPEDKSDDYWDYIKMDMMNVDFAKLKKINSDTVGFIKVNGTNINYPVVQSKNNSYYLNHAYNKSKNSAGWIFADYRNNMKKFDKNTIIYGHGRLNKTMFGSLKNILNSKWYNNKKNYIVKFSTPEENTLWQVFSIYSIESESYYLKTTFSSSDEYNEFLQILKNRSKKKFSAKVNENDKIITLSTCKDTAGKERVVMHAKLISVEKR